MLPCPRHGCHSAFPEPLDEAVALYRCDVCGGYAVVERADEGYRVYAVQISWLNPISKSLQLRKGDKVLVRKAVWYTNPMRIKDEYSIVTLRAGGKKPRDEYGSPVDMTTIIGKVVGDPVEVDEAWE